MIAVEYSRKNGLASTEKICNYMHVHSDAHYKCKDRHQLRKSAESKVVSLVKVARNIKSRVGLRKPHKELRIVFRKSKQT